MSTVTSRDGTVIDYDTYGGDIYGGEIHGGEIHGGEIHGGEIHGGDTHLDGPAVVFVGGATQYRAIDERTAQAARLVAAEGFTAVDYDRRGRGRSGDTAPWALAREVEDLAALIDAVGGTAAVYSSSSGATVALAAAVAGVGVTALALYEPPFFRGPGHAEHLTILRSLLTEGRNDEALRYNMSAVIGMPEGVVSGMAQTPWWPLMVSTAPTLVYDLTAVHEIDVDDDWTARWAAVTQPAVVLSGDMTFPGMPEVADAVAAALPRATRRTLRGQDHGPAPDAIAEALRVFLGEGTAA